LKDAYRNRIMKGDEKRNLDHVISAKEVHDDAGRVLAELDGVELANKSSNLQTTLETINKSKKQSSMEDYLKKLPDLIKIHEETLTKKQHRLANMKYETPAQQDAVRKLEDEIKAVKNKVDSLKSVDAEKMRERDEKARASYDQNINLEYYKSSKFLKQAGTTSAMAGLKMGTRQALGIVLAEIWFELREQVPLIFEKTKKNFDLGKFIADVKMTLKNIWERVKVRFQDFLIGFRDGTFAGILGGATTTLFNIFATTEKIAIKIIREMWVHLVKSIKLLLFNPDKLPFVDLCKAVVAILSVGVSAVVGTMIYSQLLPICSFPFGSDLAAFAGALVTGIVTLGLNYFLLHSGVAQKVWEFVEALMPHAGVVKKFQAINLELDRYLTELGRIEFNMDVDDLEDFSHKLTIINDEMERNLLLKDEIAKRNIELPYEIGNTASTRKWLASLTK
jgi:hypothetical protein